MAEKNHTFGIFNGTEAQKKHEIIMMMPPHQKKSDKNKK